MFQLFTLLVKEAGLWAEGLLEVSRESEAERRQVTSLTFFSKIVYLDPTGVGGSVAYSRWVRSDLPPVFVVGFLLLFFCVVVSCTAQRGA